ncbi:N-acetyltransferase [Occultella aeris]|uniref:Acetyltransferase (GNAT) family protein n=2 Tax=Occultella aeris TaxID=2761496 RepID=A0A7M4DT36_9MICO|nr:Acetyltransferase (GNAT) family protein [Occultella aeris]
MVRAMRAGDVPAVAAVHVATWQETYRGLMPDEVLDDPTFIARRERMWTQVIGGDLASRSRAAVAVVEDAVIGLALVGPVPEQESPWDEQVYNIYVLAKHHGTGAGRALLAAVLDPSVRTTLRVIDPNPRAQAFYAKHGFVPDGPAEVADGVRQLRLTRPPDGRSDRLETEPDGVRRARSTGGGSR